MSAAETTLRGRPGRSELSRQDWDHVPFPRSVEVSWQSGSSGGIYRLASDALTRSGFRVLHPEQLPQGGWPEVAGLEALGPVVGESASARPKGSVLRRCSGNAEALLVAGIVASAVVLGVYAIFARGPSSQDSALVSVVFAISALVLFLNRQRRTVLIRISVSPDPPMLRRANGVPGGPRQVRVSFGTLISRTELKPGLRIARDVVRIDPLPVELRRSALSFLGSTNWQDRPPPSRGPGRTERARAGHPEARRCSHPSRRDSPPKPRSGGWPLALSAVPSARARFRTVAGHERSR